MSIRLESVAPVMVAELRLRSSEELRAIARSRASRIALDGAVKDTPIEPLALDVAKGKAMNRAELAGMVQSLDEVAWDLQHKVEASKASPEEYYHAFSQARYMNAVSAQLDQIPSNRPRTRCTNSKRHQAASRPRLRLWVFPLNSHFGCDAVEASGPSNTVRACNTLSRIPGSVSLGCITMTTRSE